MGAAAKFSDVNAFLDTIQDLPVLPANIQKINDVIADENSSSNDIAAVIQRDQALATRILKIANSVYYGRLNQVVALNEAIMVIGLSNIKSMLYAVFIDQMYGGSGESENDMVKLWRHSMGVALLAQKTAEMARPGEKDNAYITGLVHDIGDLILYKYANETYKEIRDEIAKDEGIPRTVIEGMVLGFSHSDIGAAVARKWNLPSPIRNTILMHHSPSADEQDAHLIYMVALADALCIVNGAEGIEKPEIKLAQFLPEAKKIIGLKDEQSVELLEYAKTIGATVDGLLSSMKG